MRMMLKGKIHRIRVTQVVPNYEGSIAIDENLLDKADILQYEQVHILDVTNGSRFVTYAIEGKEGECSVNGAAAKLVEVGDILIVCAYGIMNEEAAHESEPKVVKMRGVAGSNDCFIDYHCQPS